MPTQTLTEIHNKFRKKINPDWCFAEKRSFERYTHGYHRYPAKFLPNLVKKLVEKYTIPGEKIVDLFAGCGTTLVEGKLHGRTSIGIEINPVAQLITRVKVNPIKPKVLNFNYNNLMEKISNFNPEVVYQKKYHPKIDYWFDEENRNKIAFLYSLILQINNRKCKDFFLCALSNILKNSSRWLQASTKAQIDPNKKPSEVFSCFNTQVKRMLKKNLEYYNYLFENGLLSIKSNIYLADARKTNLRSNTVNAIITSPPYVTSYEYADIHQLTGYWFGYISNLSEFRKNFIGTFYSKNKNLIVNSPTAQKIVDDLIKKDQRIACEIANYFNDMYCVANEMKRILKTNGVVCLVVGNTSLRSVKIKAAEIFAEMLGQVGLIIEDVIKREIPVKLIPTIRDKRTGRFTTLNSKNSKKVYPNEFIIIARK